MSILLMRRMKIVAIVGVVSACGGSADKVNLPSRLYASGITASANDGSTAKVTGVRSQFTIQRTATGYLLNRSGTLERIPLDGNFHRIEFSDVSINLDIGSSAPSIPEAVLKQLIELYIAFFNRVPDGDGLHYWIVQYRSGASIDTIAQNFYDVAVSLPSLTGYTPGLSNEDFVRTIYSNVLGRSGTSAPADADVNFWASLLSSGKVTRGSLIRTMLDVAHGFKGDAVWGWVANLLDNKYYVGRQFAVKHGINFYSTETAFARGREIAAAVTSTGTSAAFGKFQFSDGGFDTALPLPPVGVTDYSCSPASEAAGAAHTPAYISPGSFFTSTHVVERWPVKIDGKDHELNVIFAMPKSGVQIKGISIYGHGLSPAQKDMPAESAPDYAWDSLMTDRGYIAISVARRGNYGSTGESTFSDPQLLQQYQTRQISYADYELQAQKYQAASLVAILDKLSQDSRFNPYMHTIVMAGASGGANTVVQTAADSNVFKLATKKAVIRGTGLDSARDTNPEALPGVSEYSARIAKDTVPSLWIGGENDTITSTPQVACQFKFYKPASGFTSAFYIVPGLGHFGLWQLYSPSIFPIVRDYMTSMGFEGF